MNKILLVVLVLFFQITTGHSVEFTIGNKLYTNDKEQIGSGLYNIALGKVGPNEDCNIRKAKSLLLLGEGSDPSVDKPLAKTFQRLLQKDTAIYSTDFASEDKEDENITYR